MLLLHLVAGFALSVIAVSEVGRTPALIGLVYLAAVSVPLAAFDAVEHRLPNAVVLPGIAVGVASAVLAGLAGGGRASIVGALVGGAGYAGFLFVLHVTGGMGMGDVKLGGALGVTLGAVEPSAVLVAGILAFLVGGAFGAVQLVRGRRGNVAFGPFMLVGFWLAVILVR